MREPSGAKTKRDLKKDQSGREKISEKLNQAIDVIKLAEISKQKLLLLDDREVHDHNLTDFEISQLLIDFALEITENGSLDECLDKNDDYICIQDFIKESKSMHGGKKFTKEEILRIDEIIENNNLELDANERYINQLISKEFDKSFSDNQVAKVRESLEQLEFLGAEAFDLEDDKQKLIEQLQLFITTLTHNNSESKQKDTRQQEKAKKEAEEKTKRQAEAKAKRQAEAKAKRQAEAKIRKEAEEKTKQEVIEEAKITLDNIILKALKLIEEKAKIKEEEERARIAAEEKTKLETEKEAKRVEKERRKNEFHKQQAISSAQGEAVSEIATEIASVFLLEAIKKALDEVKAEEEAKSELEEKSRIEAEAQTKQQIEEIKYRILEKTSANFEKFQSFFNFLREKSWLDIGEMGLFGSRVYKEVINETCPSLKMPNNPRADLDIYCISGELSSSGIFAFCHEELGSRENFQEIIKEFNKINPNLQISFLEDEDGKKSVNFNRLKKSLNFKLVATFFEDEVGEEKAEKTVKEKIEFDLNFYTKQSMLKNLQWQFNIERVMLSQVSDGSFQLKINQSNCDPSQEKMTIEKFITEAQNSEQEDFLFEANPQARGFLNRIINAKGIYKYLDEETLDAIKIKLLNDPAILENLKEELSFYKDILDRNNDSEAKKPSDFKEKIALANLIIEGIKEDKIFKDVDDFKRILVSEPKTVTTQPQIDSKLKTR